MSDQRLYRGLLTTGAIASLLAGIASVTGCSSFDERRAHEQGTARQSIVGGVDDPDNEINNVVVRLRGGSGACTGTLITPQIVLTAAHCLVGALYDGTNCNAPIAERIELGSAMGSPPSFPSHAGFAQTFAIPPACFTSDVHRDVGLLFLARPLSRTDFDQLPGTQRPDGTRVAMPKVTRPTFPFVGSPQTLAISGYGGAVTQRQTATGGWTLASDLWTAPTTSFSAISGDSGGPLFRQLPGEARQPVGVFSAANGSIQSYANVASGPNLQWILDRVRHAGSHGPGALKHKPRWFTKHEKDPNDYWLGELDYAGREPPTGKVDRDGDGWYDEHDNCPVLANSDQLDTDNDDIGDACDPCPWDTMGDVDGDGVCLFEGDGVPAAEPDNCAFVPNGEQANCNREAEVANGKLVLGDACDDAPCASGHAGERFSGATLPPRRSLDCKKDLEPKYGNDRVVNDTIYAMRVAPHESTRYPPVKNPVPMPLGPTPTFGRFCQYDGNDLDAHRREACTRRLVINDAELNQTSDAPDAPYDPGHPWRRVTMEDVPRTGSWLWPYNNTPSRTETYDESHRWLYATDWADWTNPSQQRKIPDAVRSVYDLCTSLAGTCLDGRFWLHTQSATVPWERENTRNNYFELRPDEAFKFGCHGVEAPEVIWPWNKLDWPTRTWERFVFDTLDDRGRPLSTPFVVDSKRGDLYLVDDHGNPWDVAERLSPGVVAALHATDKRVVASIEPITAPVNLSREIVAVVLSADGRRVLDAVVQSARSLKLASETGLALGSLPEDMGSARRNFVATFSRAAGGVFVVGGFEGATTTPSRQVRFFRFGSGWTTLPSAFSANAKSVAYDALGKRLWISSETSTNTIPMERHSYVEVVSPWTGENEASFSIHRLESAVTWRAHRLQVDIDGRPLLVASDPRKGETKLARVEVRDGKPAIAAYVSTKLPPTQDLVMLDERTLGVVRRSADGRIDGVTRVTRTTFASSTGLEEMFQ